MKKRGFDAQEIAEKLHEKGIDVKPPTLAKYLNEFRRGKDRKTDTPRPPEKSSEFGVHQTQIHKWVKQVKESAAGIFVGEIKTEEVKKELTRLHAKIGQLTVERDFLAEAWGKRRASPPGKAWSRRIVRSSALCVSAIYSREPAPVCTMKKTGESAYNLTLMQAIDRAFTQWPFLGVRQMRDYLVLFGYGVGRKRVRRLMHLMGLEAVYQKPKTSIPNLEHKRYPYLLCDLAITRPNQVWCADITYISMRKGCSGRGLGKIRQA